MESGVGVDCGFCWGWLDSGVVRKSVNASGGGDVDLWLCLRAVG